MKCKYMFTFPLKHLARKGLRSFPASGTWLIPSVEAAIPHTSGMSPLQNNTKPLKSCWQAQQRQCRWN